MKCKTEISIGDGLLVPCGKCPICHSNRKKDWQFRLQQELKQSETAHFITLTYDDDHIKRSDTGQHTLHKPDVQKFLKRIRINQDRANIKSILKQYKWKTVEEAKELIKEFSKIRFFLVGEYGTHTFRPHYHGIFFNIQDNILKNTEEIWKHGTVDIGTVTPQSINYVTSYCINPQRKLKVKEPEFALMSRRPGIGANYLKNKNYHVQNGETNVKNEEGNHQRLPQFYKDKFFTKIHLEALSVDAQLQGISAHTEDTKRLENLGNLNPTSIQNQQYIKRLNDITKKANENKKF